MEASERAERRAYIRSARLQKWPDIEALPGYHADFVAEATIKAGELVKRYCVDEEELRPCGIAGCCTGHKEGVIVLLLDGSIARVGHICGRRLFGDETWDKQIRLIKAEDRAAAEEAAARQSQVESARARDEVERLEQGPLRRLRWLFSDLSAQIPPAVMAELQRRADNDDPVINRYRRPTKKERELYEVRKEPAPKLVPFEVGQLRGLRFLARRPTMVIDFSIKPAIKKLEQGDWSNRSALQSLNRIAADLPAMLEGAAQGIRAGVEFFSEANLLEVAKIESALATGLDRLWVEDSVDRPRLRMHVRRLAA